MMQVALRANFISLLIKADLKIGYDKKRSRDFHGLFCDQHIEGQDRVHVVDTFFQFIEKMGIIQKNMNWLLKSSEQNRLFAQKIIKKQTTVIINPCSSARKNNWRNWPQPYYAKVIDYLMQHDINVILTGGPDPEELKFTLDIIQQCQLQPLNLVGKTSLAQLLALLEQAQILIAPDTGPAHMGTVADIPVIGLYASSNPERSGPYNSLQISVNKYPEAMQNFNQKSVKKARWGQRVRHPDVMKLISADDVIQKLTRLMPENCS